MKIDDTKVEAIKQMSAPKDKVFKVSKAWLIILSAIQSS